MSSIREAYCVELGKVISIFEARDEFLNQELPRKYNAFHFLCSNESCRRNGVNIIGACYKEYPYEHKVSPYYKYISKNNQPHSLDCEWLIQTIEKFPGESLDNFKVRKAKNKLSDIIDEFNIPSGVDVDKILQSSPKTQSHCFSNNTNKLPSSQKENGSTYLRHSRTTQLGRLVHYYLSARKEFGKSDVWWKLPLKTDSSDIKYLYQYFSRVEKVIKDKRICVSICEGQYFENEHMIYFKCKNDFRDEQNQKSVPIYIIIRRNIFDQYRYRRMIRAQIEHNVFAQKFFKIYFIPNNEDFTLKQLKNGKFAYCFDIKDLRLFYLIGYSEHQKYNVS